MLRSLNALVWRNLRRHRLRTTLSASAVALGAAVLVAADVVARTLLGLERESLVAFAAEIMGFGLQAVSGVILVAAGFLVFNAFAMTLTRRRREIGALRALGLTRRQVLRLVLAEALFTGGLGTLLGLAAGPLLGWSLLKLIQTLAGDFFDGPMAVRAASLGSLLLAVALGPGVVLFSALIPAWQANRIPPLTALRDQISFSVGRRSPDRAPARLGALGLGALGLYLAVAPPGAWVTPPWDIILTGLFALAWLAGLALLLPALIDWAGRRTHRAGGGPPSAVRRLIADNLRRARWRVTLTVATLSVGLAMIVGITGIITFTVDVVLTESWSASIRAAWVLSPFDFTVQEAPPDPDRLEIPPTLSAALEARLSGRAEIVPVYVLDLPEISLLPHAGAALLTADQLRRVGASVFAFYEGDWKSAWPHLESPCGLLLPPLVARRNGVWLGDPLTLHLPDGSALDCTVAGVGSSTFLGSAIVSATDPDAFGLQNPFLALVRPLPGADLGALEADLIALAEGYPGVWPFQVEQALRETQGQFDNLQAILDGLLLLAVLTAALGVVNTTVMSVAERRRELALLRAVGATRRQVRAVVVGEAALMGLLGGGLGLVAGLGLVVILAVVAGGNSFGVRLPLWPSAWVAVRPALLNGLLGLLAAPLIAAGAAWLPTRAFLRDATVKVIRDS